MLCLVLLASFMFTRYGNERMDYFTAAELEAVDHLYKIADPGSLLLAGGRNVPWKDREYATYSYLDVTSSAATMPDPDLLDVTKDMLREHEDGDGYFILTDSQARWDEAMGYAAPEALDELGDRIEDDKAFKLIYENEDARIFRYHRHA